MKCSPSKLLHLNRALPVLWLRKLPWRLQPPSHVHTRAHTHTHMPRHILALFLPAGHLSWAPSFPPWPLIPNYKVRAGLEQDFPRLSKSWNPLLSARGPHCRGSASGNMWQHSQQCLATSPTVCWATPFTTYRGAKTGSTLWKPGWTAQRPTHLASAGSWSSLEAHFTASPSRPWQMSRQAIVQGAQWAPRTPWEIHMRSWKQKAIATGTILSKLLCLLVILSIRC